MTNTYVRVGGADGGYCGRECREELCVWLVVYEVTPHVLGRLDNLVAPNRDGARQVVGCAEGGHQLSPSSACAKRKKGMQKGGDHGSFSTSAVKREENDQDSFFHLHRH